MTQNKSNMLSIREMRKVLGFNKSLSRIDYDKKTGWISFHFLSRHFFEMHENNCDYGAFDEFAYCCINGFDSENLSDEAIIKKSVQIYRAVVKYFQEQTHLQNFLVDSKRQISKKILSSKTGSNLFLPRLGNFQSEMVTL